MKNSPGKPKRKSKRTFQVQLPLEAYCESCSINCAANNKTLAIHLALFNSSGAWTFKKKLRNEQSDIEEEEET